MLIDQSKITDVWMKNQFLLDAFKEFQDEGEGAVVVVANCVRGVFKVHAPENIESQVLIRKHVNDSDYVRTRECKNICVNGILNNIEEGYQNANIRQTHRPAA